MDDTDRAMIRKYAEGYIRHSKRENSYCSYDQDLLCLLELQKFSGTKEDKLIEAMYIFADIAMELREDLTPKQWDEYVDSKYDFN